jgi:precorrin-6B methylase 2
MRIVSRAMESSSVVNKYELYHRAVQDPPAMADFLANVYRDCSRRWPQSLREDFCGTFALSAEWVTRARRNTALAVDKAAEPLRYGKAALGNLSSNELARLKVLRTDVLSASTTKWDVIAALNFSYCIFKKRARLRRYLELSLKRLNKNGIVVMDVLGGMEIANEMQTQASFSDFQYVWDQVSFNPISREAIFHIHLKPEGGKVMRKAFVYDWRMWTVCELQDLLAEIGYRRSHVYWEGAGRIDKGAGPVAGESWVGYVVGVK